jgi:hypothetical protein
MAVQPFVDWGVQRTLAESLEIARRENAPLTTLQPDRTEVSDVRNLTTT